MYGTPPAPHSAPQLTVVAPLGSMAPLPEAPPDEPAAAFTDSADRERQATADAAKAGADITAAVLDRNTGQTGVPTATARRIAIASVVKLFIADDLLLQVSKGQTQLSPERPEVARRHAAVIRRQRRRGVLEPQRRQRDHQPGGRPLRAAARPVRPSNGRWFNTISTATDLVRYYDMMLAGTGGLPPEQASIILSNLAASTPTAPDGMVARRRLPAAVRHPRGLVRRTRRGQTGLDVLRRLATGCTCPPASSAPTAATSWRSARCSPPAPTTARETITQAVKTMFPGGRDLRSVATADRAGARGCAASDCSRRHAATFAWSPDSSTGGTSSPRQLGGRV